MTNAPSRFSQPQALRALDALIAWARAERESTNLGNELLSLKQAAARAAVGSGLATDVAGPIVNATAVALHDACLREDRADEHLREVARALLEEVEFGADSADREGAGSAGRVSDLLPDAGR